jgi:hypothetical protein
MATTNRRRAAKAPLLELDTDEGNSREVPTEPILKRDGVVYTIPVKVSADVALQYMELCVTAGPGYALAWGMQKLMGTDGYRALATFPNLTQAELGKITEYIQTKLVGAWEFPKA